MNDPMKQHPDIEAILKEIETEPIKAPEITDPELIRLINKGESILQESCQDLNYIKPLIINKAGDPFIMPKTINAIQGQTGTHKSRLSHLLISLLIKTQNANFDFLGLSVTDKYKDKVKVLYLDTELNSRQLIKAVESIKMSAGYSKQDKPVNFRLLPLVDLISIDKVNGEKGYLDTLIKDELTKNPDSHLVIFLDIFTDMVKNSNDLEECQSLVRILLKYAEESNCTFITVIHQNISRDRYSKAIGHLGSIITRKATNIFTISKNGEIGDTAVYLIELIKTRESGKIEPIKCMYDKDSRLLSEVNPEDLKRKDQNLAEKIFREFNGAESFTVKEVTNLLKDVKAEQIRDLIKDSVTRQETFNPDNGLKFYFEVIEEPSGRRPGKYKIEVITR